MGAIYKEAELIASNTRIRLNGVIYIEICKTKAYKMLELVEVYAWSVEYDEPIFIPNELEYFEAEADELVFMVKEITS